MKGMVIGGVGIVHVFLAQFAIGGGLLMLHLERLGQRGVPDARTFVDGYFRVLVLISFVVGALTRGGVWLATIQGGARTVGPLGDALHGLEARRGNGFASWTATGLRV